MVCLPPSLPQVGSELGPGEAAEAADFLSTHRACVPVSLDWLREVGGSRGAAEGLQRGGSAPGVAGVAL